MLTGAVHKVRGVFRSSFSRSIGGMMIFTALGQAVYLLSGPAIGRIFSPEEFGLYGLFYNFAATAVGLIFLNFDIAIPAASSDEDARRLTMGAIVIALIATPISGLILAVLILGNIAGFGALPITAVIVLLALLLSQAAVQLQQNWRVRRHETIVIGKSSITLNVVRGLGQVILGLGMPVWWSLAIGEVLGRIANSVHLGRTRLQFLQRSVELPSRQEVRIAMHDYRHFPIVLLPAQVLDSIVVLAQSAALAFIYGPAGLGVFFLMRRTMDLPIAFAFRSLSDVFYARLAHDARVAPERVRPFFMRSTLAIAGIGFALALPFLFIAPALFALVFGETWREAGILAAIMAPASVMNLAVAPVARIFALTGRPHLRFCFSIMNLLGTGLALSAAYFLTLDLVSTTMWISAATFVAYVCYFYSGYIASKTLSKDI